MPTILKYITLLGIIMISTKINSQEYKSILLDYSFNPNSDNLIIYQDSVYFSSIGFFSSTAGTVIRSLDKNLNNGKDNFLDGFVATKRAFSIVENRLYVFVNNEVKINEDALLLFNDNQQIDTIKRYTTDFDDNLALYSQSSDNHIFLSWFDDHLDGDRTFGIRKVDTLGNIIWKNNFDVGESYSKIWDLDTSSDHHLLISNDILLNTPEDGNEFYGQVKKMDQDGNLIWEFTTDYFLENSLGQPLIQLEGGDIVIVHKIDGREEFFGSTFTRTPEQLTFLSRDGTFLKRYVFKTTSTELLDVLDLVNGKGDYFFVIGNILETSIDGSRGIIVKFDNDGNIIWKRTYNHPDYETTGHSHFIENLVELDNGDLITLGITRKAPELAQVWLMKLNSEGCLSETNCGRPLTLATRDAVVEAPADLFFPNPSDGIFRINDAYYSDIKSLKVYDLQGALIYDYRDDIPAELDLTRYPGGIYTIQIRNKQGELSIAKVIKH